MIVEPLSFDGLGGPQQARVHAASEPASPVACCLPALGIRAAYYGTFASALAERGVHAVTADLPGHGDSPLRAGPGVDWSYADVVDGHLPALHAAVRARFPGRASPFFWFGHSLGGQVALMHAGRAGTGAHGVAGLALVASSDPYFLGWRTLGGLRNLVGTQVAAALARGLGWFPGDRVGFGGREARTLIRDWARVARTGRYRFGAFDGDALLGACEAPILAMVLAGDDWAPWSSVNRVLAKTRARSIARWTWTPPHPQADHNRWPRWPDELAERVATWVHARSP